LTLFAIFRRNQLTLAGWWLPAEIRVETMNAIIFHVFHSIICIICYNFHFIFYLEIERFVIFFLLVFCCIQNAVTLWEGWMSFHCSEGINIKWPNKEKSGNVSHKQLKNIRIHTKIKKFDIWALYLRNFLHIFWLLNSNFCSKCPNFIPNVLNFRKLEKFHILN
jgi:hypothetical protein